MQSPIFCMVKYLQSVVPLLPWVYSVPLTSARASTVKFATKFFYKKYIVNKISKRNTNKTHQTLIIGWRLRCGVSVWIEQELNT
jgi:hypothetical protein